VPMPFGTSKGIRALLFMSWLPFLYPNISITLQRIQISSILSQTIMIGLAIS